MYLLVLPNMLHHILPIAIWSRDQNIICFLRTMSQEARRDGQQDSGNVKHLPPAVVKRRCTLLVSFFNSFMYYFLQNEGTMYIYTHILKLLSTQYNPFLLEGTLNIRLIMAGTEEVSRYVGAYNGDSKMAKIIQTLPTF